jgi:hypothetical protein
MLSFTSTSVFLTIRSTSGLLGNNSIFFIGGAEEEPGGGGVV